MSPVSSSESIIDVAVCVGSELLHELFLAFLDSLLGSRLLLVSSIVCKSPRLALFLRIETKILKKQYLARLQSSCLSIGLHAVICKLHRHTEAL